MKPIDYSILIKGTGTTGTGDKQNSADMLLSEFVKKIRAAGHDVGHASIKSDGKVVLIIGPNEEHPEVQGTAKKDLTEVFMAVEGLTEKVGGFAELLQKAAAGAAAPSKPPGNRKGAGNTAGKGAPEEEQAAPAANASEAPPEAEDKAPADAPPENDPGPVGASIASL